MRHFDQAAVRGALARLLRPDAVIRLGFPFGSVVGPDALYETAYAPLIKAWPDLERRDLIVIGGITDAGALWAGCCGHYVGTFVSPWLDIPAARQPTAMRFHEFYRFEEGQVVEIQALWDIPDVMMQAGAWPLSLTVCGFGMPPLAGSSQ